MYAKKAIVEMFGTEVEVYMLPDGTYHMSKTQVGQVVLKHRESLSDFCKGNSPEALPYKGFLLSEIQIEGNNARFHSVPFEIAVAFWSYHARQGNVIAMAIMKNCSIEYITRRCDTAFKLLKSENDYNIEFVERQPKMEILSEVVNLISSMKSQMDELNVKLEKVSAENIEYRQIKANGHTHPGCLGVLEHSVEDVTNYITARGYLKEKGIHDWDGTNTFCRRAPQAMRVGKNIKDLPMNKGQVVYSPDDIGYLDETFKSMIGI